MIKYIRFQNFYSFAEEVELSFEIGKQPAPSAYDINTPGGRLNKAISVIGANGSGKSQLIKTLAFLSWFISDSFLGSKPESEIPCHPHALNTEEPSKFELEFIIDEIVYKYKLNLLKGVVNHESLHKKTSHLFSYVFSRDLTEVAIGTGNYKYKQQGFGFHSSKAEQIRHNASLISAAH
ncbi:MAG: AAA family ATPase, partial [Cellvibrionaceae bacterium]|nr:AAA family ATPase [Cellvibrionaceae bacterium]